MINEITVAKYMTSPALTVTPDTPIPQAHLIMKNETIRRLPVVKHGKLVGIISFGDIREAKPSNATTLSVWEIDYLWSELTVEDVMSRNVITVMEGDPIIAAARLMLQYKVGGLPVVDRENRPIGILTETDILKLLIRLNTEEEVSRFSLEHKV